MFSILIAFILLILIIAFEVKEHKAKREQEIKKKNFKAVIQRIKIADEVNREFKKKYNIEITGKI